MRKIYKSSLFLALLLLSFPSHAQHFDWVKTYSGLEYQSEPTNKIVRMEHDSQGNIYILGLFGAGATINGTSLLPMAPYGPNNTTVNTVIAKLSPSGELLWHKVLHSNNGVHNIARDMHIIGDSALMCLIDLRQPASGSNYLYYLDTLLLQDDNHHLFPLDSVCNGTATAFITFDPDGNVIEQHFLQRAYITNSGELITQRYHMHGPNGTSGALTAYTSTLSSPSFDVDNEGNIILSRCPVDMDMCRDTAGQDREEYSVWNGKIAAIRIYIDGARHLTYYPQDRPQRWNITLLKFSPHFEELLSVRQLIQSDSSHTLTTSGNNRPTSIIHDEENNIYVTGYLEASTADFKVCGLADTLYCNNMLGWYGFLIKYDSDLNPIFAQHIRNANRNYTSWISYFCNSKIVDSSLFVSMTAYRWSQGELEENLNNSHLYIDDTMLDFNYNTGFLRLNKVSGAMQSYGKAITSQRTELGNPAARCDIAASANRVFSQIYYINDLHLQDTAISSNGFDRHYGTMVWDYDGHPLQFIDYSATNPNNEFGNLILFDSTLYIGGMLYGAAQFDTIPISCQRSTALIAKYIDSIFIIPYVYTDTRLEQSIVWNQSLIVDSQDSVIILTASATSNLPISYICSDTSIARIISDTLYVLREGTAEVTAYQNGNDTFLPATPVVKRLEISAVGISPVNRINTIIYPSPASNIVHIKNNEHITSLFVTDLYGRRERLMIKNNTINIEHLSKGIYFFEILSEQGKTIIKIIKD